jgi:cobalamin biosynthesis protein CobT
MSQEGGLGIPAMPDIAKTVQEAIMQNPQIAKVAAAATKLDELKTKITSVPQNAVAAVKEAAKTTVADSLAEAGIKMPSDGASGSEGATSGDSANNEGSNESANEEATNEEATNEEATNEEAPENEEQSGGARYEIILLERPIQDRLFVCYEDGSPIYFTKNSKNKAKLFDPKKTTRRKRRH